MRCPVCDEVFEDKLASCPLCATPSPGVASLPAGRASLDSRIEALAGRADSVIQQATSRLAGNGDEASTGTRADFTRPVELRGQAVEALAQAGPAPPAKGLTPTAPLAFLVPLGEGLDVEVEGPRRSDSGRLQLHYASIHYGEPLLRRLVIRNQDFLPVNNVVLSIEIPRYAAPWRRTLGRLERDKPVVLRDIRLEIDVERIRQLVEADISAQLDLSVEADGKLLYSESLPVEVLAYSEWRYDLSQHPDALACFVQPNAPALRSLLSDTASCLEVLTGSDALSGYQEPKEAEWPLWMASALYTALQNQSGLGYINPPASFEIGQKVRLPAELADAGRGTCLDLALLWCSACEAMGLHPVLIVVEGHAFQGLWMEECCLNEPWTSDLQLLLQAVKQGLLLPINSTTFTDASSSFTRAIQEAIHCLSRTPFRCMVDVKRARIEGVRPLP